jgi:hypothetical protein
MNDANTIKFELDLTNIQEADDGNTTYYGGEYVLNGQTRNGYGNDRSDSFHTAIDEEIMEKCSTAFAMDDLDEDFDFQDELQNARDELWKASGTITVSRDGNKLTVSVEKK